MVSHVYYFLGITCSALEQKALITIWYTQEPAGWGRESGVNVI